jgi:hypothetical protein
MARFENPGCGRWFVDLGRWRRKKGSLVARTHFIYEIEKGSEARSTSETPFFRFLVQ